MSDVLFKRQAHASTAGLMRIDIGLALSRLRAAAAPDTQDLYFVACASVQFWADLLAVWTLNDLLADKMTVQIKEQLRRAESEADCAAQIILGRPTSTSEFFDDLAYVNVAIHSKSSFDALSKVLHLPIPECCGYDLADLELITRDVNKLITKVGIDRAFLIVGIRTGGTYLAPLWRAVLIGSGAEDVHWCTVRPQQEFITIDGLSASKAWLERRAAPVVVVVDDRPDTGVTMECVAEQLRDPGVDLWYSSVGSLWQGTATHRTSVSPSAYVLGDRLEPRLWECLMPEEHPKFIARLQDAAGIPSLPTQSRLHFRCPQGESRYGPGRPWLQWNHPTIMAGRRPLVNPRKTPLEILGPEGHVLLHLRFIGEGVFGRAEFERVRKMMASGGSWLVDGYAITTDIGESRSFQEKFHAASQTIRDGLLVQVANWLRVAAGQVVAHIHHSPMVMALDLRWLAVIETVRELFRFDPLHEISEPLKDYLILPLPWPGTSGKTFRSSLRYACGGWHWQVDQQGVLHRFQLEANWGDISFLELELAAFILENHLGIKDGQQLASLCGLAWSGVQESLSLAALTIMESRVRSVRIPSDSGCLIFRNDFHQLIRTLSEFAEIDTSFWK